MLDWLKKDDDAHSDLSMRTPASAAKLLAAMRQADPARALEELTGWLEKGLPSHDAKLRSRVLSQIYEAGSGHVGTLVAQFLGKPPADRAKTDSSSWETLSRYLMVLAHALYTSARTPLKDPDSSQSLRLLGAADAARCIHTCRTLAKACLMRYLSVPAKLWRIAYAVHDKAEKVGCAAKPVHLQGPGNSATTVTQELLRLLMLHSCAPEMMAPRQVEVADRVTEQLGQDFTLRPPGVADMPFCFDPSSDLPPHRSNGQSCAADSTMRFFGAGAGFGALERLHKELATAKVEDIKAFGTDIDAYTQVSATRHLLGFWGPTCPYTPPARSPVSGELRVIHGHARVWQELWSHRSTSTELTLVEDAASGPQAPDIWALKDIGGNELGAEIPPASERARCGDVVGVAMNGGDDYWVGVVRSVHAKREGCLHATIAILSRAPQAVELRTLYAHGEEIGYSAEAAQEFAFNRACAIVLADGSAASQTPNLLVAAEGWKEGRVYEVAVNGSTRQLRGAQLLRRGEDYARVTFEWLAGATA